MLTHSCYLFTGSIKVKVFKKRHLITDIKTFYFIWEFQVTGRDSLKTERPARPVKIAESDADVSESFCSQDLEKQSDIHPVYPSLPFL